MVQDEYEDAVAEPDDLPDDDVPPQPEGADDIPTVGEVEE